MSKKTAAAPRKTAIAQHHELSWPDVSLEFLRAPKDRYGNTVLPVRDPDLVLVGAAFTPPRGELYDRALEVDPQRVFVGSRDFVVRDIDGRQSEAGVEIAPRVVVNRPGIHPDPEPRIDLGDLIARLGLWDLSRDTLRRPLTALVILGALYFVVRLCIGLVGSGTSALP